MKKKILKYKKICLINVFFGSWPKWFSFFLQSCSKNSDIDFIFFSDHNLPVIYSSNIKHKKLTTTDFYELAEKKLNLKIHLHLPYKVCDFKPTFGKIFEEYLDEYHFWGYCDNDLIFGNISSYITQELLNEYDIISFYRDFLSGPLCLYKNNKILNELYTGVIDYKNILTSEKHFAFDENIQHLSYRGFSLVKAFVFLKFILNVLIYRKIVIKNIASAKFNFQWFFKKDRLDKKSPKDMTELVWKKEDEGLLKCYFNDLLFSDRTFKRKGIHKWRLIWENGNLRDIKSKQDILAFHFIDSKNMMKSKFNNTHAQSFIISENSICNKTDDDYRG